MLNGSRQSQRTCRRGPLALCGGSHGCCTHSGGSTGPAGGRTNSPSGENTSYLSGGKANSKVWGRYQCHCASDTHIGGFHVASSQAGNYVTHWRVSWLGQKKSVCYIICVRTLLFTTVPFLIKLLFPPPTTIRPRKFVIQGHVTANAHSYVNYS